MDQNLTTGNIKKALMKFAVPYMIACFLQTFYGMADLFVVGLYNNAATTTAVSVGSQVMHMITVIIVGFAMGITVNVGRAVGAKDKKSKKAIISTAVIFFLGLTLLLTVVLIVLARPIVNVMMTPTEAVEETVQYLFICFLGVPFITIFNVVSSLYRGEGDSKHPMYFVGVACVTNIILDFVFIGGLGLGAKGAALGTICGQFASVVIAYMMLRSSKIRTKLTREDLHINKNAIREILQVGAPIALQDGLIQVAFIIITVIANSRGLVAAASVGIVEKLIGFMFLVPSAMLSAISAVTAQNVGAGQRERAREALRFGMLVAVGFGVICCVYSQILPETLVGLFTRDNDVLVAGCEYLRAYSFDCIFAAVHFCFSGYFCGNQQSIISFIHNIISIIAVRIPGAYLASVMFPATLFPMGLAAPLGSVLSAIICIAFYMHYRKKENELPIVIKNTTKK